MGEAATAVGGMDPTVPAETDDPTGWRVVATGVQSRVDDPGDTTWTSWQRSASGRAASRGASPANGGDGGRPRSGVRPRRGVRAMAAVAGICAIAGGLTSGATLGLWHPTAVTGAIPSPSTGPSAPWVAVPEPGPAIDGLHVPESGIDWWSILAVLDARRLRALTERDPGALAGYLLPGSPAWDADSGRIAELRGRGLRPLGLATHIVAIEQVETAPAGTTASSGSSPAVVDEGEGEGAAPAMERARIVLVDQRSAYTLVDDQGAVVHSVDSPGSRRWAVQLIRVVGSPSEEPQPDAGPHAHGGSPSGGPVSTEARPDAQGGDAGWRIAEVAAIP